MSCLTDPTVVETNKSEDSEEDCTYFKIAAAFVQIQLTHTHTHTNMQKWFYLQDSLLHKTWNILVYTTAKNINMKTYAEEPHHDFYISPRPVLLEIISSKLHMCYIYGVKHNKSVIIVEFLCKLISRSFQEKHTRTHKTDFFFKWRIVPLLIICNKYILRLIKWKRLWGGSKGVINFLWIVYAMRNLVLLGTSRIHPGTHSLGLLVGLFSDAMGYCLPIVSCEMTRAKWLVLKDHIGST